MTYEPPNGMTAFVYVLQHTSPEDAAAVLALAFDNAATEGAIAALEKLRLNVVPTPERTDHDAPI